MTVVGTAEYIMTFVAQGAKEFIAAVTAVKDAQRTVETDISRAAPAAMPTASVPYAGVRIQPAAPGPVEQAEGVKAAADRIASTTGKGGLMGVNTAAREVARQQKRLQAIQQQMVRDMALGDVVYEPEMQQRVMRQQVESQQLGETAKVSLTPSGKYVSGTVANSIRSMGKEIDNTNAEFESVRRSSVLGNQVARKITAEKEKEAKEAERAVKDAERAAKADDAAVKRTERERRRAEAERRRAAREGPMNRVARASSWIMPQQGYYIMGAAETLGMPPAAMAAVASSVLTVAMVAMITSQVAQYQRQISGVAAMTGGSGAAPGPVDQATANAIVSSAARMHINPEDAMKMAGAFGQYGIVNAQNVAGGVTIAANMAQVTGMPNQDAAKATAQLMHDTGLSAGQLQVSIDRFNQSVKNTHGSVQVATQDLLTFAPLLGQSGDFSAIAGLSAFAQSRDTTATQLYGPLLTATGPQRIQQAAFLGMTPDQYYAAQQSKTGPVDLANRTSDKINQLVSQSGFSIAETVAEQMGFVTPGPEADIQMRNLMAGSSAQAMALKASGIGVAPPPLPGQPGSPEAQARRQNLLGTDLTGELGTYWGLTRQAMGQATADRGNQGVQGMYGGTFFSFLGYMARDIGNATNAPEVAGQGVAATGPTLTLDITMHDQSGNVGQATVPVTPGMIQSSPNVGVVRDGSPQGGGTNTALPSPTPRPFAAPGNGR